MTKLRRVASVGWLAAGIAFAACAAQTPESAAPGDPFAQATSGFAACPPIKPRVVSVEQARLEAHQRIERGTSCALAGTCEPGGAYRNDPAINARAEQSLRADPRLSNTSLWVTTVRKFVTVRGCIRSAEQNRVIESLVRADGEVQIVWVETTVGLPRSTETRAKK